MPSRASHDAYSFGKRDMAIGRTAMMDQNGFGFVKILAFLLAFVPSKEE